MPAPAAARLPTTCVAVCMCATNLLPLLPLLLLLLLLLLLPVEPHSTPPICRRWSPSANSTPSPCRWLHMQPGILAPPRCDTYAPATQEPRVACDRQHACHARCHVSVRLQTPPKCRQLLRSFLCARGSGRRGPAAPAPTLPREISWLQVACTRHAHAPLYLRPDRFRTQMCKRGQECNRKICFFAHR
jgi:hypothetical protein